jgi:hypothetical protein
MILTPKNWKSFQHYKDRSPAWIKLHKGLLDDFDFACLPVASRALAPCLWLLASEYEDGQINMSLDALAFRLRMTRGDLADALNPLIESEFFDASEPLAESKQDACLEKEDIEKRKRKEDTRAASPSKNENFEKFKKDYPKRAGNYGWKAAERKYLALVKTGVDPAAISTAVARHAEEMRKLKRIGTEFVPMPASWLNQEDFSESAIAALADTPVEIDWNSVASFYKKTGNWSKWAGPDPDSPACSCPPEILLKHGISLPLPDNPAFVVPSLRRA